MRKAYIQPDTTIIRVQPQNMIAESQPDVKGYTYQTGGNLSRRGRDTFWDDEDDY